MKYGKCILFFLIFSASTVAQDNNKSLYEAYEDAFLIGTALNRAQILSINNEYLLDTLRASRRGYFITNKILPDKIGLNIAMEHFNAFTPENAMKWEEIHPKPGVYNFTAADQFVEIANQQNKFVIAHTLIWHNQTPDWVFEDENGESADRELLLQRMQNHIHTVVGRYRGRIDAWDVVNEAFNQDGSYRESKWYQIIGEDYLAKAFQYAREADEKVELYYNDYSMENSVKRNGIIKAIKNLLVKGIPITGIGSQSHYKLSNMPSVYDIEKSIKDLSLLGIDIMITELDINVLPEIRNKDGSLNSETDIYKDGLPENIEKKLTDTYVELFQVYLNHKDLIKRVTFWGVSDHSSWLNYLPVERINYPLLFDRQNNPKDAFFSILRLAENEL
tara:strand:- start:36595 stop:37764 length:1170 start_codon:yes stop_codon:yes gene_type:complete